MAEWEFPYTVTAAEMELLEWVRRAHAKRFTLIIDSHVGGFAVKTFDFDDDNGFLGGAGTTFDAAWKDRKPFVRVVEEPAPEPFSVIRGGRDGECS